MLAGYALGNACFAKNSPKYIAATIVASLLVGLIAMVDYYFYVGGGHVVEWWDTLRAVTELAGVFACAGILMPLCGINFEKKSESEDESDKESET